MIENAAFPEEIAVYLSQVYGYMDESEDNIKIPMFIQYFDAYLGEGHLYLHKKTCIFYLYLQQE